MQLIGSAVLHALYVACALGSPLVLRQLVVSVDEGKDEGFAFALGLACLQIAGAIANQHHLDTTFRVGAQLRATISSLVYRCSVGKTLSELGRTDSSTGEILNLIATD